MVAQKFTLEICKVAHFFVHTSGSKFHAQMAHFFVDVYRLKMELTFLPPAWQQLYDSWSPRVDRKTIAATGILAAQTVANKDSKGEGIPGGKLVGKKVLYPKGEAIKWLMNFCGESVEVS